MSWTDEQLAAITATERMVCVDAGAGSGKTGVLIERIIHLIEKRNVSLDEIVAITFTDAAAAEMKDRLRAAFRQKAPLDNPAEMSNWRNLERQVENARLSTIHSFCTSLLRENALRIGLDPDFSVLAEAEAVLLRDEVVTDAVHALLDARDPAATRAATELGAARLIRELIDLLKRRRLIEYARAMQPPGDVGELMQHWSELADRALCQWAQDPKVREWHAALTELGACCLEKTDAREAVRRDMVAMLDAMMAVEDDSDGAGVPPLGPPRMRGGSLDDVRRLAGVVAAANFNKSAGSKKNWQSEEDFNHLKEIQNDVRDFAKENCFAPLDPDTESRSAQLTLDLLATYDKVKQTFQEAKRDRACLDFDDLIETVRMTLRDSYEVRTRTAARFKYLLIDEFQDTDSSQLEIARLLAECPNGPALFIVGDAKQSIYDFRDAEVELFQNEKKNAPKVIPLDVNFRSLPDVLSLANDVFHASRILEAVEPQYACLKSARSPAGESRVEFLIPDEEEGLLADDYRACEAELIAARLGEMCEGDARVEVFDKRAGDHRRATYGDVAILFRSGSSQYIYEESLRKRQIPYVIVGGRGFYERQEIKDMRNLLTVLVDPWDEMALLGFLRGPLAGLCDDALVTLCKQGGLVLAFCGTAQLGGEMGDRLNDARELIANLRDHMEMPLAAFLRYALERTAYEAIALSQFLGLQKAYNVRKLLDLADDFGKVRPPKLSAFVRYLDEVSTDETREGEAVLGSADSGSVTLMSVHKSKGLEFPIVVLPDLSQKRKAPDSNTVVMHRRFGVVARATDDWGESAKPVAYDVIYQAQKDKSEAEHARILYVGLTRARDWLLLSGAPKPDKSSWLTVFDDCFGVTSRKDGERLHGAGWQGVVRRNTIAPFSRVKVSDKQDFSLDGAEARVIPLEVHATRRTISVSDLLNRMDDLVEFRASRSASSSDKALLRGNLVHRLFELWDLQSEPPVERALSEFGCAASEACLLKDFLHEAAEQFRASSLGQELAGQAPPLREMPFLLRLNDFVVSGTIDAILSDGTIVDYKTGQPSKKAHARYEHQLRLYAVAAQRLTGQAPPRALVYYTTTGETKGVDVSARCLDETLALAGAAIGNSS